MLSEKQKNYRLYDSIYMKFLVKEKLQRQRAYLSMVLKPRGESKD